LIEEKVFKEKLSMEFMCRIKEGKAKKELLKHN
jgi:hypothetical protein